MQKNIARIANAVQCHSWLSGNKDCHEFRFSIVSIVINVSIVTSLQDCLVSLKTILQTCDNWDTDFNTYNWEPEFMTIFVTWQSRVTVDSIRNSWKAEFRNLTFNVDGMLSIHSSSQWVANVYSIWGEGHLGSRVRRLAADTFSQINTFTLFNLQIFLFSTCWLKTFAFISSQFSWVIGIHGSAGRCLHYIRRRTLLLSEWVWRPIIKIHPNLDLGTPILDLGNRLESWKSIPPSIGEPYLVYVLLWIESTLCTFQHRSNLVFVICHLSFVGRYLWVVPNPVQWQIQCWLILGQYGWAHKKQQIIGNWGIFSWIFYLLEYFFIFSWIFYFLEENAVIWRFSVK